MHMSVSRQMGAAQCWSCAGAKWVCCSPLPVAPGEEELCWSFSGTGFKTQLVLVEKGLKNQKEGFCGTVCKVQLAVPWQAGQCHLSPKNSPKAKSPGQHCSWFVMQPAQAKPEVSASTTCSHKV